MRPFYRLLAAAALGALVLPQQANAQEDPVYTTCPTDQAECVVEWADETGNIIINALRNTIANDENRPAGRIYVLQRGGYYLIEDRVVNDGFDLLLFGQTEEEGEAMGFNVCGDAGNEDCGPAIIQRVRREDNTVDGVLIESNGDGNGGQQLRNIWVQGQDNTGITANYEPIVINSSNSYFLYENVIFDRNDWHHLGFKAGGNDVYFRDTHFRNLVGPTQRYEGRAVRFEAGADTVVFENNSFINLTSFIVQSEAAPIEYFLFNHNTLVNFGLSFSSSPNLWKEAYVTNNIMVNPFFQGESADLYNAPNREDPYSSVFGIDPLPPRFGLETDRRILLANNNVWRSPELETFYQTFDPVVRAQPFVNDTTAGFFNRYEGMVMANNLSVQPGFERAPLTPEVYEAIRGFVTAVSTGAEAPYPLVVWDPGRDFTNPLGINFPLPEDLSYDNNLLLDAGTDDLPLGDLNWFTQAKETYLLNREDYLDDIKGLAGPPPREPIATPFFEAEDPSRVTLGNGATLTPVEGNINLQTGRATWTFTTETAQTIALSALVALPADQPAWGINVFVDGTKINTQSLYGETMVCREGFVAYDGTTACQQLTGYPLPANATDTDFNEVQFNAQNVTVGVDALTLQPGTHTVTIASGWGGNFYIKAIEVLDGAGNTIEELTPVEAETEGITPRCGTGVYCPSGFQYAALGSSGSLSLTAGVPEAASSVLPRISYQSTSGATATVSIEGTEVGTVTFPATTGTSSVELALQEFNLTEAMLQDGTVNVTLTATSGDLNIDSALLNVYGGGSTSTETLPEGWALGNSFPNPTTGTATIRFALAEAAEIELAVYDVLGRKVSTLADGPMTAGPHEVRFNADALASGTYIYRLTTPVGVQTRRLTVVR